MSPGKDYAPCTHCGANNITHRSACWRCGASLPYTIGLDGKPRANSDWSHSRVNRAEIDRLLDQAQTIDIEQAKRHQDEAAATSKAAEQKPSPFRSSIWRWLRKAEP